MQTTSPEYVRPPVVETVLGVQFDRLPRFGNAHLGDFWCSALGRSNWPTASDAPPLEPQFERFGESTRWSKGVQLKLSHDLSSRLQIRNEAGDRMIQVQNGRFHLNWMGKSAESYPRYNAVQRDFCALLTCFSEYVAKHDLGELKVNQWEVTYLNQIPQGTVWRTPSEWDFFRPLEVPTLKVPAGELRGESFGGEWHFLIPNELGRLHVQWRHGLGNEDQARETIVLTFTARGPVAETNEVTKGLNLGHDVIVWAFAGLMSQPANDYWGLKHGNT